MPKFTKNVTIDGVDRIYRPGIGYVYKGKISIGDLAEALKRGDIKYAPKYQRGQKKGDDVDFDATTLLDITDPKLDIQVRRAQAMAAKYVMGMFDKPDREFYNPDIIWNARKDDNAGEVEYSQNKRTLTVHSTITIPDSAHRHYCYYLLYQWQHQPESIPVEVVVADDGTTVDGDEIREYLENFDPFDEEKATTFVEIFNVPADHEGRLFDEYNVEGKRPTPGAAIDMFSDKTASRRFVDALMKMCPIFDRSEIEMRSSTIAAASRKITTVSTLDVAIKPYQKDLLALEKNKPVYDDLIAFFSQFYAEWAKHYQEYQPTAFRQGPPGPAREILRDGQHHVLPHVPPGLRTLGPVPQKRNRLEDDKRMARRTGPHRRRNRGRRPRRQACPRPGRQAREGLGHGPRRPGQGREPHRRRQPRLARQDSHPAVQAGRNPFRLDPEQHPGDPRRRLPLPG